MLTSDNIKFLLTLPPEDIVRWYEGKGFRFSWNWQDTWQEAHTRSFTVAKVMKMDILQAIKKEVDKIFKEGITYEQFYNNLEGTLKELGWWGKVRADQVPGYNPASGVDPDKIVQLGSPRRLKTIYQVNSNVANNAGRWKFFQQNAASRPYLRYHQLDRKTKRKSHTPFHNKVFHISDPVWNIIAPPSDWMCGCYLTAHTADEVKDNGWEIADGKNFIKLAKKNIPAEWQYNPGKEYANWQPDLSKYDDDIKNAAETGNIKPLPEKSPAPAGIPVSSSLKNESTGEIKNAVEEALKILDSIHGDGNLPSVPVKNIRSKSYKGALRFSLGQPIDIKISHYGKQKELTTLHEIGHLLDLSAIGTPGRFESLKDDILASWKNAAFNSEAIKKIFDALRNGVYNGRNINFSELKYLNYLRRTEEIFARSYAQYIAVKSKNKILLKQVDENNADPISTQWDKDDFREIEKEFDKLFRELGWRV